MTSPDIQLFRMSLCEFCQRYHDDKPGTCDAYPDGIPEVISSGKVSHTKPYKGDHGLTFLDVIEEEPSNMQDRTSSEGVQYIGNEDAEAKKKPRPDSAYASGSD